MNDPRDKKALKILFDRHWSPAGWKSPFVEPDQEAFDYAKSRGMMFDPVSMTHGEVFDWLFHSLRQLNRQRVADAFLASLSTRRLDWRSALGSYAVFQHVPSHEVILHEKYCRVCGHYPASMTQDFNVLNFERHKWGGVRHDQPCYAAMDLGLFLKESIPAPSAEDIRIFRSMLAAIRNAPARTTGATLQAVFGSPLKSNKAERDAVVALLGFCGILATPEHPGFSDQFVAVGDRVSPNWHFADMKYPACWWRGENGVDEARLLAYFGHVL